MSLTTSYCRVRKSRFKMVDRTPFYTALVRAMPSDIAPVGVGLVSIT
jgi:hypothetical protein